MLIKYIILREFIMISLLFLNTVRKYSIFIHSKIFDKFRTIYKFVKFKVLTDMELNFRYAVCISLIPSCISFIQTCSKFLQINFSDIFKHSYKLINLFTGKYFTNLELLLSLLNIYRHITL